MSRPMKMSERKVIFSLKSNLLASKFEFLDYFSAPDCGTLRGTRSNPLVIGGVDAGIEEFPWHASIFIKDEPLSYHCGGALISKNFVLTGI
jgi:hypothetical protein